ncbi:hypothetical protein DCC82_15760 [Geobacillus sp. LYN3]|nr:hypothetical protein DCC82_15760 [Geobacillus sp. LYN3]
MFVSLLTFYRKGALFSIHFGFYWIINTPDIFLKVTNDRTRNAYEIIEEHIKVTEDGLSYVCL